MLPFILYKDLGATPFQIALLITLKPLVAIFSMYWSYGIRERADRLRSNIVWATVLSYIPFLFVPFAANTWYLIAASGLFMLFNRGVIPAWMELLKSNVSENKRKRVFSWGSTFCYLGGGGFPFLIGWLLDGYFHVWVWLYPATALLGMLAIVFQWGLKTDSTEEKKDEIPTETWQHVVKPWHHAWTLIRRRRDFARFQWGFMFGGAGLMIMQPALPMFFVDNLKVSYTEIAVALTLCKGIGFALASPAWASWMNRIDIYRFSATVTTLAALFPVALVLVKFSMVYLFLAYIAYGIMQAGSELSWNLSGTMFAKNEDSSIFTGINVVMVGIRGCIAPPLGSLLCAPLGAEAVLLLGGGLCLAGTASLIYSRHKALATA